MVDEHELVIEAYYDPEGKFVTIFVTVSVTIFITSLLSVTSLRFTTSTCSPNQDCTGPLSGHAHTLLDKTALGLSRDMHILYWTRLHWASLRTCTYSTGQDCTGPLSGHAHTLLEPPCSHSSNNGLVRYPTPIRFIFRFPSFHRNSPVYDQASQYSSKTTRMRREISGSRLAFP